MLQESGFEPPAQFRQLAEFTLGRRFEQEIAKQQRSRDPVAYRRAIEIAGVAARRGYQIDKSVANESFGAMINDAVSKAVEQPSRGIIRAAMDLLALSKRLALQPNLDVAQEAVYQAFARELPHAGQLARLGSALGLAQNVLRPKRSVRGRTAQVDGDAPDGSVVDERGASSSKRPRPSEPRESA